MAIKSLEQFLFERGLVGTYPLDSLKNSTLGIDMTHYVSRILTVKKEQYLDAIGGFPNTLKLYLESDLKIFKEFNITPIFIFDGSLSQNNLLNSGHFNPNDKLQSNKNANNNTTSDNNTNKDNNNNTTDKELSLLQRNKAWTQWNNLLTANQSNYIDQPPSPNEPFHYYATIDSNRYQQDLINYFIEHDIHYQIAPFQAWSQLAYLYSNNYIDSIYGPTDCLMLSGVNRFILGMEFPNNDFRYIDKNKILKDIGITLREFVDISMAVGNTLQPLTLPPLQIYPKNKIFEIALEMVLNAGTNFYLYQLSNQVDSMTKTFLEQYQRGISHLKYMPVMLDSGKVDLYINDFEHSVTNKENKDKNKKEDHTMSLPVPNDVHDFITQRLPNEYYFYKSIGLATGKLFNAITTGVYPEDAPLSGGSSDSYRKLVKDSVTDFKNKELNLLTQPINRYFQMKQIKQINWFTNDNDTVLLNRTTPSIFDKLNHLIVKQDKEDLKFSISSFVKLLSESTDLAKDFISKDVLFPNSVPVEKKLNNSFDLLSTTLLRSLVQLEFFDYDFDKKFLKPTRWGEILLKFNNDEMKIDSKYQENLLILLIFLKTKVLDISKEFNPPVHSALSDHTLGSYPQESSYILLLTRVLTLFQVEQKPANYHGPIDKKTLIFQDHLTFIKENMNDMFESILVSSLTANEFNKLKFDNYEWQSEIVSKMPFKLNLPNVIMAIMWEFFLQKYLHNGNSKDDAMSLVSNEFNTYKMVPNLDQQFVESLKFLEQSNNLFKELASARLMNNNDATAFNEAVTLCKTALKDE